MTSNFKQAACVAPATALATATAPVTPEFDAYEYVNAIRNRALKYGFSIHRSNHEALMEEESDCTGEPVTQEMIDACRNLLATY